MHVLLISHEFPPYIFGGIGMFVKDLAIGLSNIGLDVTVICGKPVPHKNHHNHTIIDDDRFTTIRLPYPNIIPRHMAFQIFNKQKLKNIIEKLRPDIIHGQSGQAFPAIVTYKKIAPVVVTFHTSPAVGKMLSTKSVAQGGTFGDFLTGTLGYPAYEHSYREEYKNADARVAVSKSLMHVLSHEMNVADGSFQFITNGVDLTNLDELCTPSPVDRNYDKPTLLFGGRLFWSKGVLNLVDLAYLLEKKYKLDLDVVIYGSGPMYNRILDAKRSYGINNLTLKEFTSRSNFLNEMRQATLVLLPSPFEGAPMMMLESMCLGKVPVTFNLPYAREFTQNGKYGLLCDNVQEMALKIKDLLSGSISPLESQVRHYGRTNYNIEKTATAYYNLYKKQCAIQNK
ncbi:MAG: glycosyltransferase family 4 protein [Nitrososphaerota archaeon]|jgi:glycosyltransferase involved in cell wall biosynthesis|uniref:glycosyltransferase family 4 protein n=1 Tax=Candidatus Bathycorpusculum sp. TaxID=2994959 RepID=UPI002822B108|nr:glycosyltransferase family 4 protein [Candidatus Termitimicrobium sp.]MDR0493528.1 glycosyltransferase family 4 protein [Nitrososphaerota archaeon]